MSAPDIYDRAMGALPLSIATSLAIESACGIHPEIKVPKAPILGYQELWINLRTLFRNLLGSLDKEAYKRAMPNVLALALEEEMDQIRSIIKEYSNDRCEVVFYVSNYKDIERRYPHAVVRRDNTENQKSYTILLTATFQILLKRHEKSPESMINVFDLKLHNAKGKKKAMIITHYAFDLLSHKAFEQLSLLESHTGKIKEQSQWYTKYYEGNKLSRFPFREDFVQIFGDSETFRPGDNNLRRDLMAIAEKYNWNALITHDKIVYGINQLSNPYYRDVMKEILV